VKKVLIAGDENRWLECGVVVISTLYSLSKWLRE